MIARGDKPQVKLVPVEKKTKRHFGAMKGQFAIDDRFFEPLPETAAIAGKLSAIILSQGFQVLEITMAHGDLAGSLLFDHRDPFDRLLIEPGADRTGTPRLQ